MAEAGAGAAAGAGAEPPPPPPEGAGAGATVVTGGSVVTGVSTPTTGATAANPVAEYDVTDPCELVAVAPNRTNLPSSKLPARYELVFAPTIGEQSEGRVSDAAPLAIHEYHWKATSGTGVPVNDDEPTSKSPTNGRSPVAVAAAATTGCASPLGMVGITARPPLNTGAAVPVQLTVWNTSCTGSPDWIPPEMR